MNHDPPTPSDRASSSSDAPRPSSSNARSGSPSGPPLGRLAFLFLLYFVQGLPFGFQGATIPVFLREAGHSFTVITLASAVILPWWFKLAWAPWVERHHWPRVGRRRSWIIPLQIALAITCAAAAFTQPDDALIPLLVLVFFMNLFAATMDIAVDGLTIDTLPVRHLGYGNIAQVVGYKLGIITAGGFLLAAADTLTWTGVLGIMAGLIAVAAVITSLVREPDSRTDANPPPPSFGAIVGLLVRQMVTPAGRWILIFIATYKFGESIADALFKPFLIDVGFTKQDIGVWVGTYGMVASIAGSFAGGILASRFGFLRAVAIAAALRVIPVFGEWWLTWGVPGADAVIAVTVAEHFFGGVLTTAMFAFMMSRVDRRIGATHFTAFATIEVIGKTISGALAGVLADATSLPATFGLATLLSAAYLLLLIPIARFSRGEARGSVAS